MPDRLSLKDPSFAQSIYIFRRPLILITFFFLAYILLGRIWTVRVPLPEGDVSWYADQSIALLKGKVVGVPENRGNSRRFVMDVFEIKTGAWGDFFSTKGRVLVHWRSSQGLLHWGDVVEVQGKLNRPKRADFEEGFNYQRFLSERRIYSSVFVTSQNLRVIKSNRYSSLFYWLSVFRYRAIALMENSFSPETSGILAGLVFGKKPHHLPEVERDFRRSGTYHLLVASGSNVGFFMALWIFIGRWVFLLRRKTVLILSIGGAFFYAGMAGADPPVLRAAVMASIGVIGFLLSREDRLEHAIFFSALLFLVFRPTSLFEAGFQMSYAATLGVIMIIPFIEKKVFPRVHWTRFPWVTKITQGAAGLFFFSLAAQLSLAPLLIYYFHRFSWVGVAANLLAVPLTGLSLVGGTAFLLMGGLFSSHFWGMEVVSFLTKLPVLGLWKMASFFGSVPGAEVRVVWNMSQCLLLAGAVVAWLIAFSCEGRGAKKAFLLSLVLIPFIYLAGWSPESNLFRIFWPRAGQSGGILLLSPNKKVSVIDVGKPSMVSFQTLAYLEKQKVKKIDNLFLFTDTLSNARGAEFILKQVPVGRVLSPVTFQHGKKWKAVWSLAKNQGVPYSFLKDQDRGEWAGMSWEVWVSSQRPQGSAFLGRVGEQAVFFPSVLTKTLEKQWAGRFPNRLSIKHWPFLKQGRPLPSLIKKGDPQWFILTGRRGEKWAKSYVDGPFVYREKAKGPFVWSTDGKNAFFEQEMPSFIERYQMVPVKAL